ncbi:sodium- and chloride-dependent neutral and basic amino acid transporter B(0+)-like [Anneissia japonica]|uniref:sodium- and chloride-dependent neutral and basic amino acid transporter B(0+)-like n=1 Tax=Anneissia japonica TaxID=1529436 RepID=UPI0014258CCC|nr:sodium- and chloride-dependent neutral and basic amino acid transporter B(0+)-like [Anneissia japonica]
MANNKGDQENDENPNYGNWSNKCEFILSCLGSTFGLGNVWRFPYLAYSNGGGAFLVPYTIMLFFVGMPVFFMEVSLSQYSSEGPIAVWRASPMFRGIGFGMVIVAAFVGTYYNVVVAYAMHYMFASFTKNMPWENCDHDFNTNNCTLKYDQCLAQSGQIMLTTTCQNISDLGKSDDELIALNIFRENDFWNTSLYVDSYAEYRKRPTEEYWKRGVLQESPSMNDTGGIVWQLALCLLLAWVIVFFCVVKGIKSSGKAVYFTATFPFAVILALLIRSVTLEGAKEGINFFIYPEWKDITIPQVWYSAATQILFSLSIGTGILPTLSSHNRFHNNIYFDTVFIPLSTFAASIISGITLFSILGHLAFLENKPVSEVVDSGFGLAFIVYPEGLSLLPGSNFWAILFFFMLITLGFCCEFVFTEIVVTAICDGFPSVLQKRKTLVRLTVCIMGYVLSLVYVSRSGAYWVSIVDSSIPTIGLIMFGLLELVAVSWVYGIKRFTNDIRSMLGDTILLKFPLFFWWQVNWTVITPSLLLFVLLYNWMNWSMPKYNDEFYPLWGRVIGWVITVLTIVFIPLVMIYEFLMASGSVADRWRAMSRPRADWGPQMDENRAQAWQMHKYYNTTMGGKREAPDTSRY